MISWPPRRSRHNTVEPQCAEIEFFDEDVDDANGVVFLDIVVKARRQ